MPGFRGDRAHSPVFWSTPNCRVTVGTGRSEPIRSDRWKRVTSLWRRSAPTVSSEVLVEWTWNAGVGVSGTALASEIGDGVLRQTEDKNMGSTNDFNNKDNTTGTKGLAGNCGIYAGSRWWNFDENRGEGFQIEFSTNGNQQRQSRSDVFDRFRIGQRGPLRWLRLIGRCSIRLTGRALRLSPIRPS